MEDELLVSRAIDGDLDAFGQLYDAYFGRIYDFAWRMLHEPEQAGQATQAIFVDAARSLKASQKSPSFEAWLFGRAQTRLVAPAGAAPIGPGPSHEEGFGAFEAPDPCRVDDPRVAEADPELPCVVWEAAASLSPRDHSLLDLHLRQKIDGAELAHLVGVSRSNAPLMLERLELAASGVIATYVLAKRGTGDCEELRTTISGESFPPLTNELRTRVEDHAATCPTCRSNRTLRVEPLQVFAALLPVAAPFVLKGEVWRSLAALWPEGIPGAAGAAALPLAYDEPEGAVPAYAAAGAVPFDTGGGRAAGGGGGGLGGFFEDDSRRNMLLFAAAAGGMLIVAFVVGAFALKAFGSGGGGGGAASLTKTATATPRTTLTPGVVVDTATPRPSATAGPTDTPVPPPPDTPTPPPPPPPPTATPAKPTSTPVKAATPTPKRASATPTRRAGG